MTVVPLQEGRNICRGWSKIECEKIFKTNLEERRGRRKSYYWEVHDWCSSWNIIRGDEVKNEMRFECRALGKKIFVNMAFMGKPEEKWSVGRYRYRWKDNVKMWLEDVEWNNPRQNSGKSQAAVNFALHKTRGTCRLTEKVFDPPQRPCFLYWVTVEVCKRGRGY